MGVAKAARVRGEGEMRSRMSEAEHGARHRPGLLACLRKELDAVFLYRLGNRSPYRLSYVPKVM